QAGTACLTRIRRSFVQWIKYRLNSYELRVRRFSASWDCVSPVTNCVFDTLVQAGTACLTRIRRFFVQWIKYCLNSYELRVRRFSASWDCVSPVTNCMFDALVQAGTACLTRMIFESDVSFVLYLLLSAVSFLTMYFVDKKWTATVKNLKQDCELTTGSGATYDDIRITSGKRCRDVNDKEAITKKENDVFSSDDPDGLLEFKHDELEELEQQITISSVTGLSISVYLYK
ncbi:2148_t:CDS:2, partial [Paraglomus occultum]